LQKAEGNLFPKGLEYMYVQIWDGDYVVISSQNTRTTTSNTLYPVFNLILDTDGDFVDDNFESQLAEKFSPVLHKHSWEKQQDLSSVDWILTGKATLKGYNILGQEVHSSTLSAPSQIHIYQQWHRDSFGSGDYWTFWQLDIDDSYRYQGAPVGQRPVYYHVYKEGNYYYVQYWFFFNMNDLAGQSNNNTWHEADFEHVSIKVNSAYTPVAVNFYRHEGGRTFAASDCWWSSSDSPTYSGIAQGYSSSRTHLHIWTAANAHASYNRYSKVWRVIASGAIVNPCLTIANEDYTDNVDYDPSSSDLYFENDYLEKLGEFRESPLHQASNGQYYPYAHNYHWLDHNEPVNNSKPWLCFVGRFSGDYWAKTCFLIWGNMNTQPPLSPIFDDPAKPSHEWKGFTEEYSPYGFGNPFEYAPFSVVTMMFNNDIPDGD